MIYNVEVEIELVEPGLERAEETAEYIAAAVRKMGPEVVRCDVAVVIEKRKGQQEATYNHFGGDCF